jgi:hypothetical protein
MVFVMSLVLSVLTGVYHAFSDDTGRLDFGDEWDFLLMKKFGKHYSLLAKYAYYNAGNDPAYFNKDGSAAASSDTQKIWLQANVNF